MRLSIAGRPASTRPAGRRAVAAAAQPEVKTVEPAAKAEAKPASAKPEAAAAEPAKAEAAAPAQAAPKAAPKPVIPDGKAEIYIGFEKGDYAPREGRTGRVIVDDPSKYPDRTALVGGWPGGEVALKSWAPKAAAEAAASAAPAKAKPAAPSKPSKPAPGTPAAPIYVGHAKDDYEGRRVGRPGRFINDNPARYPDKESIGPLTNATGGFAGGEVGVKAFAATGDLPLKRGDEVGRQFSPLVVAAIVAGAAGLGGALLNSGVEVAEGVVEGAAGVGAPGAAGGAVAAGAAAARALLDPSTRGALAAGAGLLALTGGILAVRGAVGAAKKRAAAAAETVADGAKAAAFWVAVFLAVKLVIESS